MPRVDWWSGCHDAAKPEFLGPVDTWRISIRSPARSAMAKHMIADTKLAIEVVSTDYQY